MKQSRFVVPAWETEIGFWKIAAGFSVCMSVSGFVALLLSASFESYTGFWLPSGVFLGALLVTETRRWGWLVLVGMPATMIVDLTRMGNLCVSLGFYCANAGEALVGAWLVRRFLAGRRPLENIQTFGVFLCAGVIFPPAVSATIGATVAVGANRHLWPAVWWTWWGAESIAILLLAPALMNLLLQDRPRVFPRLENSRKWEGFALVVVAGVTMGVLAGLSSSMGTNLKYAILPLMLWAGIRFGLDGAVALNALLGIIFGYVASHNVSQESQTSGGLLSNSYTFLFLTSLVSVVPALVLRERDKLIRRLGAESQRNEMLFETALDGNHVLDMQGRLIQFNETFRAMLGYPRDVLSGMNVSHWDLNLSLPDIDGHLRKLVEKSGTVETRYRCQDGRIVDVEIRAKAFEIDGTPCIYCSARDVTGRKALEENLRQSQKLESVGRLAGGVAHDFNNILTAMMLALEMNAGDPRVPEEVGASMKQLLVAVKRAAGITEQLLLFARRHAMRLETVDLNEAITVGLRLVTASLGESIEIKVDTDKSSLWVRADPSMLYQVLMNLSLNARDAMPRGGVLRFSTGVAQAKDLPARADAEPPAESYARLTVSDTGVGIPANVLPNVFEPFYTTKGVGKGTGLGLATVQGIVHQHRGWITVASEVGKGTTFDVYLPTAPAPAEPPVKAFVPAPTPVGPQGRILLVEDEEAVRIPIEILLGRLGYEVVSAANGPEALAHWDKRGKFDLLFTDVIMPGGMNGFQLISRLRQADPALRVLAMSGYNDQIIKGDEIKNSGIEFIAKPFDIKDLAGLLNRLMKRG